MSISVRNLIVFVSAAAFGIMAAGPAEAFEIVGLPGSTWGQVTHDADSGLTGTGFMGFVNQGIDWTKLPGDITLNTFVEYRYRTRTENSTYYDTQGPAIGIELKKTYFRLGADYYRERLTELDRTSDNKEFYFSWYYDWDLRGRAPWFKWGRALPGSTWGFVSYDMNSINGSGAMGFVNQGIDWAVLPGDVVFNTFAEYRHRSRTRNKDYYDAEGPAIGIEFRKSYFRFGIDYYWERFTALGESSNKFQYYVTWFYDWNLKKP